VASEVADGWWKRLDELAWQNEVRGLSSALCTHAHSSSGAASVDMLVDYIPA
jgi:hypothetical protein